MGDQVALEETLQEDDAETDKNDNNLEVEEGDEGVTLKEASFREEDGPGLEVSTENQGAAIGAAFKKRLYTLYQETPGREWQDKMSALIQEQSARADSIPPITLAVAYNAQMDLHADDTIAECTRRCREIWKHLEAAGILEVAKKLEEPRMATREEILNVHSEELLEQVESWTEEAKKVENNEEERRKFEDDLHNEKTLLVNKHTLVSARLAAGQVLQCVDHIMKKGGAAMSLERPPGRTEVLTYQ